MKHITLVVPDGEIILSSVVGPFKIFNAVNNFLIESGQSEKPFFNIELVGSTETKSLYGDLFSINHLKDYTTIRNTDLIIIPAIMGDFATGVELNKDLINWIKQMRTNTGCELASLCMGAFILADTGLMDGLKCSTHWMGEQAFRQMYPKVNLIPENIITDENGIYSSGGAYSFLNLILYLVEKYVGREVAIWASKVFEVEIGRTSQSHFSIFSNQKTHTDSLVSEAQTYIEANFAKKLTVEEVADKLATSTRNFIRRFKKATHNTPLEYITRVKIEAAKRFFEANEDDVYTIMNEIGYNDVKSFRKSFKKITGLTPAEYKKKYARVYVAA